MKPLLTALLLVTISVSVCAQESYWQQQANFSIDAKLDVRNKSVDASMEMEYINHSPDTLSYIWFHIWPNAYKNDRTAFSEQMLENGSTDFYFSQPAAKGYINKLSFTSEGQLLKMEDHPQFIDAVKILLSKPLLPNERILISASFHVKLPALFSRSGYVGNQFNITQWYPKPAVYDKRGWHVMPYLDQGEFYSEFGNYDVRLSVPVSYVVAATGALQNEEEKTWMKGRHRAMDSLARIKTPERKPTSKKKQPSAPSRPAEYKTLRYLASNVHDFAWFADRNLVVDTDTVNLASGKPVEIFSFYHKASEDHWKNVTRYAADALRFRSEQLGEYPYPVLSVVQGSGKQGGGMEYPTITVIDGMESSRLLDYVIQHEIGHNWFYGMLASNEREYPWMDEGFNSFYDYRYLAWKYGSTSAMFDFSEANSIGKKLPEDEMQLLLDWVTAVHQDQPVKTRSEEMTNLNYNAVTYIKTAKWLQVLEKEVGSAAFDSTMKKYFENWKFRHPQPEDFFSMFQQNQVSISKSTIDLLDKTGPLAEKHSKKIKPVFLFNFRNTDSIEYINFVPAAGFNMYDGFMAGLIIHNYNLPPSRFRFALVPLYGFKGKELSGLGSVQYNWYPKKSFSHISAGFKAMRFSTANNLDSNGQKVLPRFYKVEPSLRFVFKNKSARSTVEKWIEIKSMFIGEQSLEYQLKTADSSYYPSEGPYVSRYLNQLTFGISDSRKLYPYDLSLQLQQGKGFGRGSLTANYFYNYPDGGGLNLRFFAGGFAYLGNPSTSEKSNLARYQPKLTAVRGAEDYTYSNYFIGRTEFDGFASQQMMVRDGALKLRTDLFSGLQGRSEKWISSMNFSTTLPFKILPKVIPIRLFFDVGTYAEAWDKESAIARFLYVGGLQLSLFRELVNIYAPVIYSQEFKSNLETVPEENSFFKRVSFSIDIHRINLKKLSSNKLPF